MGAFYINTIDAFIQDSNEHIIGSLTFESGLSGFQNQLHKQTLSWEKQIIILKENLNSLRNKLPQIAEFGILLEYPIARRAKRIDAVIISYTSIIVLEFKVGNNAYNNVDIDQLLDYCLDIHDFHFLSRDKPIYPILISTEATLGKSEQIVGKAMIMPVQFSNGINLSDILSQIISREERIKQIDFRAWNTSRYSPTPTIIEAAINLFANNSVEDIAKYHADAKNLTDTCDAVVNAIKVAKDNNDKIICFITGVPGAGKTLAGLAIAHNAEFQQSRESLVTFLSGNGPLIKVLKEALSRDSYNRLKESGSPVKKKEQDRSIAFIENVHRFIDNYFSNKDDIPNNRIVIFDEAQRAWNAEQSNIKFNRNFSEPELMLDILSRHQGWAVIVALIGGGQEINTGEAGLREWGDNLVKKFSSWKVYISPELKVGHHSTGGMTLFDKLPDNLKIIEDESLHLDVTLRSYKAENFSKWVQLVLNNKSAEAQKLFVNELKDYPLVITRDLDRARDWLRNNCKGTRRMGLVASSGARRLRPMGLEVKLKLEEEHWFLNGKEDIRSSYSLEIPATEFGIQGLELDWVGVCWDADLRRNNNGWECKSFKGTSWLNVNKADTWQYTINKYRVLLTRAREGMIIYIPEGDANDKTRLPEFYDPIFDYLQSCGVPEL